MTVATPSGIPFAVVRTATDQAIAVNAVCTHQGCTAVYQQSLAGLHCDCHGSSFAVDGTVTHGPAQSPLSPLYPAQVGATSIRVTVG